MLVEPTEDQIARAKVMVGVGLDVEQVSHWLAAHEADKAELRRFERDYEEFEEVSPPDVPRRQFVRWCFEAWEAAMGADKPSR